MEKIFDIAKDFEQKWGVIAKTIDRNNENLYYYSNPTSGVIDKNDNDGTQPKKGFKEIAKKIASFIIANKTF